MRNQPYPIRKLALDVLHEWSAGQDYAAALIDEASRDCQLPSRDTALLQTLVLGVLRNESLLDFWADILTQNKQLDRETRLAVRLGLVQLLVLDMQPHAAVNETVEHAGRAGALVNAVLRRALREKDILIGAAENAPLHIRTSHPEWLVKRWTAQFGERPTATLCDWNQNPAPLYVRVNKLRPNTPEFEHVRDIGDGFFQVASLPHDLIQSGAIYVQDPSTALAPNMLAPTASHAVLDTCAAPGGKTAIMAQLMRNDGRIMATDVSIKRIKRMTQNLDRLGVKNVSTLGHDWLLNPKGPVENKMYDRILLDVPCSNTGVMRRRVDVRWRLRASDITALTETQYKLLEGSLNVLKPGGFVVYSTCSIDSEENEQLVQRVLDANPGLSLVQTKQLLPQRDGLDGAFAAKLVWRG